MKNKGVTNFIIDALMFLDMAFLAGLGFLIKYTLPPGKERILKYGENTELYFLGLDRHQWGTIHLYSAFLLLALLVLHIVLHWNMVVRLYSSFLKNARLRTSVAAVFVLICAALLAAPFFITPDKGTSEHLHHNEQGSRGRSEKITLPRSRQNGTVADENSGRSGVHGETGSESKKRANAAANEHGHEENNDNETIRGNMTLNRIAVECGISTAEVKKRIGIPAEVPSGETLGRLRREYGFDMAEAKAALGDCAE